MNNLCWQSVAVIERSVFSIINQDILKLQKNQLYSLPNFRKAPALLIGSDYSGESSDYPYTVYSFLLMSNSEWAKWEPRRVEIRQKYLSDFRRMSFKNLNDIHRKMALLPLLDIANSIDGISFSVAIHKQAVSLFDGPFPLDLGNKDFAMFRKWKKSVLEKAFTAIHFIGFLLAGFCKEGQDIYWFTDEDNIAANNQRISELTKLFAWVSDNYLTFSLGRCYCGTSRCDNGSMQIEDLLAIPDLIAGAISEQLKLRASDPKEIPDSFFIFRPDYTEKSSIISWWFSTCNKPLKRLLFVIDPSKDHKHHLVSFYHFHSQI